VQGIFDWLLSLPVGALYAAIGLIAGLENLFPPFPSDLVIAFGAFLAAQGHGTAFAAFLATFVGNVSGAMVVFGLGWKYGAQRLEKRLAGKSAESAEARMRSLYGKYGLAALFASRFIPGVRAIVPPFAGALRIPPGRALLMMGTASAIWYGTLTYVAFTVGEDWDQLAATIKRYSTIAASVAALLFAGALLLWYLRRRRTPVS
jgi:membrane protein DedA with SNARE-associated domain